jgi:hypothetical protein
MNIRDLRNGDVISFESRPHTVEHVSQHPSGLMVIFRDSTRRTGAYLDRVGWEYQGRRLIG